MKISKSKQELASIISENGGWRDGAESAAQCMGGEISFWSDTATKARGENWCGSYLGRIHDIQPFGYKLPNWHQTILSRDEYFHLYPASDADGWIEWKGGECPIDGDSVVEVYLRKGRISLDGPQVASYWDWSVDGVGGDIIRYRLCNKEQVETEFCESVMRSIPEPEAKPTIEKLASDYCNAKDYADRKQEDADAAKADADAKLKALELAGKELGLVPVSVVKPAIDGCMQLVDMVPTRLQSHQDESVAAIGYTVNVERLYDKVRDAFDLLK